MIVVRSLVLIAGALLSLALARIVVGKALGGVVLERAETRFVEVFGQLPDDSAATVSPRIFPRLNLTDEQQQAIREVIGTPSITAEQASLVAAADQRRKETFASPTTETELDPRDNGLARMLWYRVDSANGWIALSMGEPRAVAHAGNELIEGSTIARGGGALPLIISWPIEGWWHTLARAAIVRHPPTGLAKAEESLAWIAGGLERLESARPVDRVLVDEAAMVAGMWQRQEFPRFRDRLILLLMPWGAAQLRADTLEAFADLGEQVHAQGPLERLESHRPARVPGLRAWLDPLSTPGFTATFIAPNWHSIILSERRLFAAREITRAGFDLASGVSVDQVRRDAPRLQIERSATGLVITDPIALAEADPKSEKELALVEWRFDAGQAVDHR